MPDLDQILHDVRTNSVLGRPFRMIEDGAIFGRFFSALDCVIGILCWYPFVKRAIWRRLDSEAAIFKAVKTQMQKKEGPIDSAQQFRLEASANSIAAINQENLSNITRHDQDLSEIDHCIKLLEINHQRVSGSISHISIMLAVLLFSYLNIFQCVIWPRRIVSWEIVSYLGLAIFLLRCLRDFGLDWDHYYEGDEIQNYGKALRKEIVLRFAILRTCNFSIIFGTIIFASLLASHLWNPAECGANSLFYLIPNKPMFLDWP